MLSFHSFMHTTNLTPFITVSIACNPRWMRLRMCSSYVILAMLCLLVWMKLLLILSAVSIGHLRSVSSFIFTWNVFRFLSYFVLIYVVCMHVTYLYMTTNMLFSCSSWVSLWPPFRHVVSWLLSIWALYRESLISWSIKQCHASASYGIEGSIP